jgi:hypothetical protein
MVIGRMEEREVEVARWVWVATPTLRASDERRATIGGAGRALKRRRSLSPS